MNESSEMIRKLDSEEEFRLHESILLAHDYASLMEQMGRAIEEAIGSSLPILRLTLSHPTNSRVRIQLAQKRGIVSVDRPHPVTDTDPHPEFLLGVPTLVGAKAEILEGDKKWKAPKSIPDNSLLIPLEEGGETCGVLHAELVPEQVEPLRKGWDRLGRIARAARKVITVCHEFERVRFERNDMQEIFEATTYLQGTESAESLAQAAAEVMVERLGADRSVILWFDKRASKLVGIASHNCDELHRVIEVPILEDAGILAETFRQASAQWVTEISERDPIPRSDQAPARPRFHALCLPLIVGNHPKGVIYADHRENRAQITLQRLIFLQLFANNIGATIEAARLIEEIGRLADQDGLTGLANRRAFDVTVRREVLRAARYDQPLSILMIDIDRFKHMNDTYGHLAGDQAIIATAHVLQEAIRETDFVARYGGDEFVVLMPNTDATQAGIVKERIIEVARKRAELLDREKWHYSLSCGLRSARGQEAEQLLESADKALYAQKEAQVRRSLLQTLVITPPEELHNWNHYLSKILRVLYEKEPHYHSHALRVMNLCVSVASRAGWERDEVECVALAALLHDVGKISIPGSILSRPGPLSSREYKLVQAHTKVGMDLLKEVHYMGETVNLVGSHHERWDGNTKCEFPAYPGELAGEDIPRGARLLKLCDSYDAMTSPRPYSTPISSEAAVAIIREEAGRSFDPGIVEFLAQWVEDCESRPLVPVRHS
ncbi:diguanylate cyclase [bacterium]|nr:diguanylate cyclase [bacterium]